MLSLTWSNKSFKLKPKLKKRNSKQNGQAWRHGGTNQIYDVSLYHDDFCKTFEVDWKCHDCCMEFCICCLRLPLLLLQIVILFGDLFITRLNFAFFDIMELSELQVNSSHCTSVKRLFGCFFLLLCVFGITSDITILSYFL